MALGERKRNFLSKLRDVLFTSLTTSDILQWNGTKWVNVANAVFRSVSPINTGSLLVWNGTEVIGTLSTVTLNNADLTLYNNTLPGGTLRVQNNTRSSVLDATSLTIGNDVTLFRPSASVLQVGTGAVPDALAITDYLAVNRQSSTQEREVVRWTATMPVTTDNARTGLLTGTVTDFNATRTWLQSEAIGTYAQVRLGGAAALLNTATTVTTVLGTTVVRGPTLAMALDNSYGTGTFFAVDSDGGSGTNTGMAIVANSTGISRILLGVNGSVGACIVGRNHSTGVFSVLNGGTTVFSLSNTRRALNAALSTGGAETNTNICTAINAIRTALIDLSLGV